MSNRFLPHHSNPMPPPPKTDEGKDWQRYADGLKSKLNIMGYYMDKLQRQFNYVLIIFSVKVVFDIFISIISIQRKNLQ
jgi:hypothetical protein